jgi:hypothetical protein
VLDDDYTLALTLTTKANLLVHVESLFGFRADTAVTMRFTMQRDELTPFERQQHICENVVPLVFPPLLRPKTTGLKVRFKPVSLDRRNKALFSGWSPASPEGLLEQFLKVSTAYGMAKL